MLKVSVFNENEIKIINSIKKEIIKIKNES
jgi:hypothetical protein